MGATSTLKDDHDITHINDAIEIMKHMGCRMRVAVDIGAHRGIWTRVMLRHFDGVHAFEPVTELFDQLPDESINHNLALMDKPGRWSMKHGPHNDGQGWLSKQWKSGKVRASTLDLLLMPVHRKTVDFIKIDTEGAEALTLAGANKTIIASRPFIMIEENGLDQNHFGLELNAASTLLKAIGMRELKRWNKDTLFGW